jgi:ribosomal protein L2
VGDDGFAARTTYRIAQEQAAVRERREIIEWSALLLGAAVFLAFIPLGSIVHAIEALTVKVGNSFPVAVALAALILTATFTRFVVDRAD